MGNELMAEVEIVAIEPGDPIVVLAVANGFIVRQEGIEHDDTEQLVFASVASLTAFVAEHFRGAAAPKMMSHEELIAWAKGLLRTEAAIEEAQRWPEGDPQGIVGGVESTELAQRRAELRRRLRLWYPVHHRMVMSSWIVGYIVDAQPEQSGKTWRILVLDLRSGVQMWVRHDCRLPVGAYYYWPMPESSPQVLPEPPREGPVEEAELALYRAQMAVLMRQWYPAYQHVRDSYLKGYVRDVLRVGEDKWSSLLVDLDAGVQYWMQDEKPLTKGAFYYWYGMESPPLLLPDPPPPRVP